MRRTRHLLTALALLLLAAVLPTAEGPAVRAEARAWGLWVHVPGRPVVEVATATAVLGSDPTATAAPVAVAGTAPRGVRAGGEAPEDTDELWSWLDPTASMSLRSAGMEARVGSNAASARVTAATGSGSGFALADELFTWEQQEQLLGAWGDTNAALFAAVNDAVAPLGPLLATRDLTVPRLEPMAPLGFVDVAGVEQVTARTDTAASPGFASAAAASDVARLTLFGGFVQLDQVRSTVLVEQSPGGRVARPTVSIGRLRIAGIEVAVSEEGLVVASNDMVPRVALQPLLDDVLERLAAVGIRIEVAASRDVDGRLQASAFELEVATADGMAVVSVGHVEAAVGEVVAAPPAPTPTAPATDPVDTPATGAVEPGVPGRGGSDDAPSTPAVPPSDPVPVTPTWPAPIAGPAPAVSDPADTPATVPTALRLAAPSPEAARALGAAYTVGTLGGLAGLALLVALVGGRPTPPRRPRERS